MEKKFHKTLKVGPADGGWGTSGGEGDAVWSQATWPPALQKQEKSRNGSAVPRQPRETRGPEHGERKYKMAAAVGNMPHFTTLQFFYGQTRLKMLTFKKYYLIFRSAFSLNDLNVNI